MAAVKEEKGGRRRREEQVAAEEEDSENEHDARRIGFAIVPGVFSGSNSDVLWDVSEREDDGNVRRNRQTEKFVFVPVVGRAEVVEVEEV